MANKHDLPTTRWISPSRLNDIGNVYLVLAVTTMPILLAGLGKLTYGFGLHDFAGCWFVLQLVAIGLALGIRLTVTRDDLSHYEQGIISAQQELDCSPLVRTLYRDPALEYRLLKWGTLAAHLFVALVTTTGAYLVSGGMNEVGAIVGWVACLFIYSVFMYVGRWATGLEKGIQALFLLLALGMIGAGFYFPALAPVVDISLGSALLGVFNRVRSGRFEGDNREMAAGSSFYIASEIHAGLLVNAYEYGGGYERAKTAISLMSVEEARGKEDAGERGWRPAVGDLHRGQTLDTDSLADLLRKAAANEDRVSRERGTEAA